MQNLEWYLADLKSTGKNTIETVEKSLTDMFIRLVRIYPCLKLVLSILDIAKHTAKCVLSRLRILSYQLEPRTAQDSSLSAGGNQLINRPESTHVTLN